MQSLIKCSFPQKFCDAPVGSNRDNFGGRQEVTVSQAYREVLEDVKIRRELVKGAKHYRAERNSQKPKNRAKKGDSRKTLLNKAIIVKNHD